MSKNLKKGKLSVHTENILPIIKKWLYSEKEIFIRELISNSFDSITKLKKISMTEEIYQAEKNEYGIDIGIDREKGILTIKDNGIGMTGEEIEKYITQIAFSGAEDFIKKYEESKENGSRSGMIGNFGLGFYSSFMVSSKVEIETRSFQQKAKAAYWTSDGAAEYELGEGSQEDRGATIILHIEDKELLDKARISELVRKYCDFIPIPIRVDGAQVNRMEPLWAKSPASLEKKDYVEFYKYLFPFQSDPLFYVHLNVDYPFRLQGILYFPKIAHELDLNRSSVKIYCKQIFVSDEAQDLIPKYLTVLQGVIDLPDLPLNVSRSYLQNEPQIRKISMHIVKKVADRLNEEYKKSREEYNVIWPDIAPFIKFSAMSDDNFYNQISGILIYEIAGSAEGKKFCTLEEYVVKNKTKAGGKIYYASDPRLHSGPIKLLQNEGIEVLLMNTQIDAHFLHFLESKNSDYKFARVDAEVADSMIDKDGGSKLVDADETDVPKRLQDVFKKAINNSKVQIRVEALKSADLPAMILLAEHTRRFSEMTASMTQNQPVFPEEHTLLLNSKNEIIKKLGRPQLITGENTEGRSERVARQIYTIARLTQGGFSSEDLEKFAKDTYHLLEEVL